MLDLHRQELNLFGPISETDLKKLYFKNFSRVSLSTYNKYLKELRDGTYDRCERQ